MNLTSHNISFTTLVIILIDDYTYYFNIPIISYTDEN